MSKYSPISASDDFLGLVGKWFLAYAKEVAKHPTKILDPQDIKNSHIFKKYGPISYWNTTAVTNMANVFSGELFTNAQYFNQPLNWDTSNVTDMSGMFSGAKSFNQPLNWDTSNVTDMSSMFANATSFNQPVAFDYRNVTDLSSMFAGASKLNQYVDGKYGFDSSTVTDLSNMFYNATMFNSSLFSNTLEFNVTNVTDMHNMFAGATAFNQTVVLTGSYSSVTDASGMFAGATSFNQELAVDFSLPLLTDMSNMFAGASSYEGQSIVNSLDGFEYPANINMTGMFQGTNLTSENNDAIYNEWLINGNDGYFTADQLKSAGLTVPKVTTPTTDVVHPVEISYSLTNGQINNSIKLDFNINLKLSV